MANKRNSIYDESYEQLYQHGLSLSQVAGRIGVTRQSVFKAFKNRGFALREQAARPEQFYDGKKFTLRNHGYYERTTGARTLLHRYIWTKEKGDIPPGWDVHHIDENKENNCIENFECLPKADHTRLHQKKKRCTI